MTMVGRKLNKPTYKVRSYPLFWLQEYQKSKWFCKKCGLEQSEGSIVFEMYVRFARKDAESSIDKPVKLFLCLTCAEDALQTTLDKVRLAKNVGAQGYKLFDEV